MKSKSSQSLAVIIPMHNEQAGVKKCVETLMKVLPTLTVKSSLIAVDDGSQDKTNRILRQLKRWFSDRLIIKTHAANLGYGAGLATGIKTAASLGFSHAVFMDSDLTNDPNDLAEFVKKMDFDLVKASRYIPGGKTQNVPWKRRLVSVAGNYFCRICFRMGIHDYTNGFRMVNTKLLSGYNYREKGFAIILEEMFFLKQRKAKCAEIPVTLTSRVKSASHFQYSLSQFLAYLKYALKAAIIA